MDTSGKGLLEFWRYAGNKGLVPLNTANAKRAACSQVLGAMDDWEALDVSALNVEEVFRRFTNKRSKDFTPESLITYKSRFTQALADFLAYTKDPASWKPKSGDRAVAAKKERPAPAPVQKNGNGAAEPSADTLSGRAGLVEYPFPLREGTFAFLRLPADLKMAEVRRLTAYLNTLAEDAVIS